MDLGKSPLKRCNFGEEGIKANKKKRNLKTKSTKSCLTDSNLKDGKMRVIPFMFYNGKTTKHLVRSNGELVDIDILSGKHLLILCASLPSNPTYGEDFCLALIEAYSCNDFEMVLVATIKQESSTTTTSDSNALIFYSFFSRFPCLALPFSDFDTRHYISSTLGVNPDHSYPDTFLILVDPSGKILKSDKVIQDFLGYGSEWFPFLPSSVKAVDDQDEVLKIRLDPIYEKAYDYTDFQEDVMNDPLLREPPSLYKDILCCEPSLVLQRLDGSESLTVLDLTKKYVGLYLVSYGGFRNKLMETHQHCLASNKELEIVVVFLSLFDHSKSIFENLSHELKLSNETSSWFVFPGRPKVLRRMWRVFAGKEYDDKLIIVPPNCKFGELEGKAVIQELGMGEYPFTRSSVSVRDRRLHALRSLNPASLFKDAHLTRKGCNICASELKGKRLLLYLDWHRICMDDHGLYHLLLRHYPEIRKKGWEVVLIPLDWYNPSPKCLETDKMPWPVIPLSDPVKASVRRLLLFPEEKEDFDNYLCAVESDGKVLSRESHKRLFKYGVTDDIFDDDLHEEMTLLLSLLHDSC